MDFQRDKRRHVRIFIRDALVEIDDRKYPVRNISEAGLFFECAAGFEENLVAEMTANDFVFTLVDSLAGSHLVRNGKLVRCVKNSQTGKVEGIGICFEAPQTGSQ